MRLSQILISTLRDDPADAEIPSHKLLARAGFIVKIAAGVYVYSPLMWRVVQKFAQIVREELDREGANEVMLPIIQPMVLLNWYVRPYQAAAGELAADGGINWAGAEALVALSPAVLFVPLGLISAVVIWQRYRPARTPAGD